MLRFELAFRRDVDQTRSARAAQPSGLAVAAGLALTRSAAAFVLTSPLFGWLAERVGSRFMMSGGVAIIGCGLLMIASSAAASS
jgi:MFS family permease